MKKLLLTFAAISIMLNGMCQVVVFSEDFDGVGGPTAGGAGTYTFPPNWLLRNVDNGTPATNVAYVNEAWERREDFSFNVADSCAFSTSWYTPAGTANDWMWTPAIALPNSTNLELHWNAVTYDASYRDGYEVRIMTVAPTGGTGNIGNQLTNSTLLYSNTAENTNWTSRSVSLAAYANQTVYIGFRNNSSDKFLLLIDDVEVIRLNPYDAYIQSYGEFPDEHTFTPLQQAHSFSNLGATIRNAGSNTVTNVYLQTEIFKDGSLVFTGTSNTIPSLAPGATTAKLTSTTTFVPTQQGAYQVKYTTKIAETDAEPLNDTAVTDYTFIVDSTYARDNGSVSGSLGIGAGTGDGIIASSYAIHAPGLITSVTYLLTGTGQEPDMRTRVKILGNNAGLPTTVLRTSADHYMIDSLNGEVVVMPIDPPLLVAAGDTVWVGVEEVGQATMSLGMTTDIYTSGASRVNWSTAPLVWGKLEAYGAAYAKAPIIRPNFSDVCPTITSSSTPKTCTASGTAQVTLAGGVTPYIYAWSNGGSNNNITANPGTYTVTITSGTCTTTTDVTITDNSYSLSVTASATPIVCTTAGTVTTTVAGGSSPYVYAWSNSSTADNITVTTAGPYGVSVVDINGCSGVAGASVTDNSVVLNTSVTATASTCTEHDGSATATTTNGTGAVTYNWSNGGTNAAINNVAAGIYTVTATDANGCAAQASVSVTANVTPLNTSVTFTAATCTATDGSATATTTNGTGAINYDWSNGATTATITNVAAGTYTVTASDANGCSAQVSVAVTANITPLTVTAGNTSTSCTANTGSATATVTTGTSPYTYAWSNSGNTATISNIGQGNYSVTVTDANGCSGTAGTLVTTTNGPSASATAANVNCFGGNDGSVNVTTTGGTTPLTYNWNNSTSTEDLSNVGAGTYTLTVTDANSCSFTVSATVTQPASALSFTATVTDASTSSSTDGSIVVSATGGTSPYTTTPASLTNLAAGTYVVTVTDANGCTAVDTFTVDFTSGILNNTTAKGLMVYPNPTTGNLFVTIQLPIATDLNVTMQSVTGAVVYSTKVNQVTNSTLNISMQGLAAGIYTLQVTGAGETQTRKVILQH